MPLILRIVLALALGAVSYYLFTNQFNLVLTTSACALLFISPLIAALISPLFVAAPKKKTSPSNPKQAKVKPAARTTATSGSSSAAAETGEVKWFNVSKGYGFITRDNGDDIFVHYRSIIGEGRRNLREGQMVEFIAGTGDKGPQAESVQIID